MVTDGPLRLKVTYTIDRTRDGVEVHEHEHHIRLVTDARHSCAPRSCATDLGAQLCFSASSLLPSLAV